MMAHLLSLRLTTLCAGITLLLTLALLTGLAGCTSTTPDPSNSNDNGAAGDNNTGDGDGTGNSGDGSGDGNSDGGDTGPTTNLPPGLYPWQQDHQLLDVDGDPVLLTLRAQDPEGTALTFDWTTEGGELEAVGDVTQTDLVHSSQWLWYPRDVASGLNYDVVCVVTDADGHSAQGTITMVVIGQHVLVGEPPLGNQSYTIAPATLSFGDTETDIQVVIDISAFDEVGAVYLPWRVSDSPTWLTVTPSEGTEGTTLSFHADRESMSPGRYSGVVNITLIADGLTNVLSVWASLSIPVEQGPLLDVAPLDHDLGAEGTEATFDISNIGGGTLTWSCSAAEAPWLTLSPSSGVGAGTMAVTADRTDLLPGAHVAIVRIESDGGAADVVIRLWVPSPESAILSVDPTSIDFGSTTATLPLHVSNIGLGTLTWQCESDSDWMAVSPASGTDAGDVTVMVDRSALSSGSHRGFVRFASDGGSAVVPASVSTGTGDLPIAIE